MVFSRLLILLSAAAFLINGYALEPRNLALIKQDLIRYHDSGEYERDIARIVQQAKAYLQSRLAQQPAHKKLAIVLDIDETALSNYPDMLALDFGGSLKEIENAEGKGTDPVIKPTLELYQMAKAHEVAVFFITARREIYRSGTALNLQQVGYQNWDGLYLLPMDYHQKSVTAYKESVRQKITEQGYDIVLSLSDQNSDLRGRFADKTFKLPDPFYLVQ